MSAAAVPAALLIAALVAMELSAASSHGGALVCTAHSFSVANLSGMQMYGEDYMLKTATSDACMQACCAAAPHCTAWNYHVSSTDPTHHPRECWLSNSSSPTVQAGEHSDVWVGGSKEHVTHKQSGAGTGGGATIQPLSKWYYFGAAGNLQGTLNRELTDQSISLLRSRASSVIGLGSDKQKWLSRQEKVFEAFGGTGTGPFAPLPATNRSPPKYNVTKTLRRPGYTCELILYETRPGFYASGAIWTPTKLKTHKGGKAPGVLMVSGHTSDGFRSNNLGGPPSTNDPPDDDYQVVEINLVARGFVVLAFDPIGQGERMQYADIKAGRPDPAAPWGKEAPGAFLWGSTSDHEYIGRQLLLNGVGLMSFWLHDEMISLDLLESLPQVDSHNLGVVGCSGGGTQSSYLGAMDSRVKAASMACYISTKEIDMLWNAGGGGDGEQTWPHGIFNGLDKPDLIEVRGNQSTQVLITSADTCFPAAGGIAAVTEAQPAYDALGGELHVYEGVWHHGWVLPTREQINSFFCKALAPGFIGGWNPVGCTNSTEIDVSAENPSFLEWSDEELKVTSTGQINTAPECIAPGAHISKTVHNFSAALTDAHVLALIQQRKQPASFLPKVIAKAPVLSGFVSFDGVFTPGNPRFLGAQFVVPRPPGCIPGRFIPGCPNPPTATSASRFGEDSSKIGQELAGDPIGLVEQHQVLTEGQCFALVTIYFPAHVQDMTTPREKMPLVVWYSANVASASAPPDAANQLAGSGHAFALVELCGFGTTGPRPSSSGLASSSYAPEDLAHEIGRSVPGFHAGEIDRVHAFLSNRRDVQSIVLAVAEDHTDTALLHALLSSSDGQTAAPHSPKNVAIVSGQASLAAAAKARLYSPDNYYSWIFGMLAFYDKTDLVAALLSLKDQLNVLLLGPLDELLRPLSSTTAAEAYQFASEVGGARLTIEANVSSANVLPGILNWLKKNEK